MLKIQKLYKELVKRKVPNPLERICSKYGIDIVRNQQDGRIILSYNQINSQKHKYSQIVRECRGLVVEESYFFAPNRPEKRKKHLNIIAYPFNRFYNYGESREEINKFNWNNFTFETKEDGSMIVVYHYNYHWKINTTKSYGDGVLPDGRTWDEHVRDILVDKEFFKSADVNLTYIFEFCSPWNKNVRSYGKSFLSLLNIRDNRNFEEFSDLMLDYIANLYEFDRPQKFNFKSVDEALESLELNDDATFEGYVLKDNIHRIKIKSKKYLNLHHLKDNGNIVNPNRLIPLLIAGEEDEVLAVFPELSEIVFKYKRELRLAYQDLEELWELNKNLKNKKDFALKIKHHDLSGILFSLWDAVKEDSSVTLQDIWKDSEKILINNIVI